MQEQKLVKTFRTIKIIQLCLALGMDIAFFLVLTCNTDLSRRIFSSKALFTLCITIWIIMLYHLLCLLFDFFKLRSFAIEIQALGQAAYMDKLTGIPNRFSLDNLSKIYNTPESLTGIGCAMFTISNLAEVNDKFGHAKGDLLLQDFCEIFENTGNPFGFMSRNGGNEFVAVIEGSSHAVMQKFIDTLNGNISLYNKEHADIPVALASAYTLYEEIQPASFKQLLTATYKKLHASA